MESSPLGHAAAGASITSAANGAASQANDHANAASNGSLAASNETDLWGALSPMGDAASPSFGSMPPVVNVSQASLTQSSAANPFDAFDAFAPASAAASSSRTSSASLVLPPPAPQAPATAVVALGSPLISFSPVASSSSASLSLDTTTTATAANAFAVDDLLSFSFSPVAAPPASSSFSSSSLMMMDDFFLGSSASARTTASHEAATAYSSAVQTTTVETTTVTTNSLLSFSPVASAVPQPPFFDGFGNADLSDFSRGSVGGFEGEASIDHIAPHSAPAAFGFGEMDASLQAAREVFKASIVVSAQEVAGADEHETLAVETESVAVEENDDQDFYKEASVVVKEQSNEQPEALASNDDGFSSESDAWDHHEIQDEGVVALAGEQDATSPIAAEGVVGRDVPQQPAGFDHDQAQEFVSITTVEAFSFQVEASIEVPKSAPSPSSSDAATTSAEAEVVETVNFQTLPETVDSSAFQTFAAEDEQESESVQSPVSSVAEVEAHGWQAPDSPGVAPEAGFDILSASSADDSRPSGVAVDRNEFTALEDDDYYEERESGVMESQFESEAAALYAEVDDEEDEYNAGQSPVLNVSVAQLQLPLPDEDSSGAQSPGDRVNTPSSVVSSPGSSVAGSAFAFISGGESSFAFAPSVPSPQPESPGQDVADGEDLDGDEDHFSPVASEYVVSPEDEVPHVVEEDSGWTATRQTSEESAGAQEEFDESEGFQGFNDRAPRAAVHHGEGAPTTQEEAEPDFSFPSSSGAFHQDEDVDDDFGGFNDAVKPVTGEPTATPEANGSFGFQSFTPSTDSVAASPVAGSAFGFLSASQPAKLGEDVDADDDGFGGFRQSTATNDGDDDDDFGDFGTANAWGSSTVSGSANDDDDDDFGDFTPSSASQQWGEVAAASTSVASSNACWGAATYEPQPQPVAIAAPADLNEFFSSAFPASKAPVAASLLPKPAPSHGSGMPTMTASAIFDQANGGAVHKSFHASLQEYRTMLTAEHDEHPQQQQPSFESEALRLKYLKYVLTEKLTEASRPDGVFPHGSEKYHLFASIAESGHEKNMRDALSQLQEGLFQGSVNEAVMRIAKQAALSAKARIAEQAAQQQAHTRGSLLATTRHFLSRSAASGPGSAEKDARSSRTGSGSLGVLTPTSASVHKMSRFAFQIGQESEVGNSSGYGSGEDTGSDVSVGEASGHSEGDVGAPSGSSGGSSGPPSGSSGRGGGGLMKKFHERLTSFSSTKQRPRTVSLRRMGQSSEDVVKMELHMESINGGFDEVKWRCAVFLYESEEVAHLAPSQIKILAYPSNQLLSGKSDRSALSKFFKPGTIWSIDIGANSNAGVSME